MHAALDRLHAVAVGACTDGELDQGLQEIHALRARLDAADAQIVGEWDRRTRWAYHGAKSPAAYLAATRRLPIETCRRAPRVARKLRHLPGLWQALAAGRVELPHVQRILLADTPRTHERRVTDHVGIVGWAMDLRWGPFCRRLQDWLDEHDPDGAAPDDSERRRLHCSKTIGDGFRLDGWLDAIRGSIVAGELDRLERQLFEADWAAATAALGRDPMLHDLARSPEQRRADALVLMAERSAVEPDQQRRGRPLFTVLTGDQSLRRILELTNGIQLRPSQLAGYVDPAMFEYVLFDSPLHVIGISRQRNFRGLLRKAVQVAHRRCDHATCDEPIDRCEVDHIHEHAIGGPTSQDNGRLRCGFHNRARNKAPPDNAA